MSPLHDVRRRPVRSALTAAGMAIGVAALVLLGGLAEKLGRLVEGGRDFATGQITVSGSGTGAVTGMTRGGLHSREQLAALGAVPGVALVAPLVMFPLSVKPASTDKEQYIDPEALIAIWPLRLPVTATAGALMAKRARAEWRRQNRRWLRRRASRIRLPRSDRDGIADRVRLRASY